MSIGLYMEKESVYLKKLSLDEALFIGEIAEPTDHPAYYLDTESLMDAIADMDKATLVEKKAVLRVLFQELRRSDGDSLNLSLA